MEVLFEDVFDGGLVGKGFVGFDGHGGDNKEDVVVESDECMREEVIFIIVFYLVLRLVTYK